MHHLRTCPSALITPPGSTLYRRQTKVSSDTGSTRKEHRFPYSLNRKQVTPEQDVEVMEYPHIKESRQFSNAKIEAIRSDLQQVLGDSPNRDKITIVTTGSYGRKEAS